MAVGLLVLGTIVPMLGLQPPAVAAQAADGLVISQIYAGAGSDESTFDADFVVLFNAGATAVDITDWSLQYASGGGTSWTPIPLSGAVPPGGSYLVRAADGTDGAALPPADADGGAALSGANGKLAVVDTADPLTCGADPTCAFAPRVQDFVGYGPEVSAYRGTAALSPGPIRSLVRLRAGCTNTEDNGRDFDAGIATPLSSASSPAPCSAPPAVSCLVASIHDIQGAAHRSPVEGCHVTNIEGVVTRLLDDGFYLEDPHPDADPATSEGILVFTDEPALPEWQDQLVRVNGEVVEYRRGASAGIANLAITELVTDPTQVTLMGAAPPLPDPVVIGAAGRTPPTEAWTDVTAGDVERDGTFDPATDGLDFWESLEAMRVVVEDAVIVGVNTTGGNIPVVADGGAGATSLGARMVLATDGDSTAPDDNPERIMLDPVFIAESSPPPVAASVGQQFVEPVTGIVDYSYGNYVVRLTEDPGELTPSTLTLEVAAEPEPGQITLATMNVENLAFDNPDPNVTDTQEQEKFNGLAQIIVFALHSPDIIVVQEIQDNNGTTATTADPDKVVDASLTADRLIRAIEAFDPVAQYAYADVPPVYTKDGGAVSGSGNIRVGFLYRLDHAVELVDRGGAGGSLEAVTIGADGALSANPGRIRPDAPAFANSRKPLVGEFRVGGQTLYVIGNHFSSKLGSTESVSGRFRPPLFEGENDRRAQAAEVRTFVAELLDKVPGALIAVVGDFNDPPAAVSMQTLTAAGLVNAIERLPAGERYSAIFQGHGDAIDQIFVSPALEDLVIDDGEDHGVDIVHVNVEFTVNASDHDPVIMRLEP